MLSLIVVKVLRGFTYDLIESPDCCLFCLIHFKLNDYFFNLSCFTLDQFPKKHTHFPKLKLISKTKLISRREHENQGEQEESYPHDFRQ